jgi:DNA-nicking Smr family endonuclease
LIHVHREKCRFAANIVGDFLLQCNDDAQSYALMVHGSGLAGACPPLPIDEMNKSRIPFQ